MENSIIKEASRDALALGGWVFCILVIARATIGEYLPYAWKIIAALFFSVVLSFAVRDSETRISRLLILAFFTVLFYNEIVFSVFAAIAVVLVYISAFCLGIKKYPVIRATLIGALSSALSFLLFKYFLIIE